ncbi:MAG: TIGR03643 family protein [Candidatus Puniceispirillaceae bacterium]
MAQDNLSPDIHHVIELAWRDEVSFDDIKLQTGLGEKQVIAIMRGHMKPSSFRMWRKRVSGRKTKHQKSMAQWRRDDIKDVSDLA